MDLPAQQVHVLVVDDSVVIRRVIARALERDPVIARTDFAGNGRLALAKIAQRRPDVVVLDIEMPVMDGFETLMEIRRLEPDLPVVLFSSVDERVAAVALDALSLGAAGGTSAAVPAGRRPGRVDAVVLGVSTGGPDALATLLRALPARLAVPLLVVQHMPPMFTRLLAERLDRLGGLAVREAEHGEVLQPSTVYLAPGGRHLRLVRDGAEVRVELTDDPPENSCRPAADVLFRSAVEAYGPAVLAVVLTGMGQDGLRGCQAVRAAGGHVLVQDPATAVVGSMPGSVLDAGLAHASLPIELLVPELVSRLGSSR
ncbi:MAG: response regulator [Actinobacteria bacterium]|nr:response regulator [Actinomycetota bacterium]